MTSGNLRRAGRTAADCKTVVTQDAKYECVEAPHIAVPTNSSSLARTTDLLANDSSTTPAPAVLPGVALKACLLFTPGGVDPEQIP
jgi:hypothetical protein